MDKKFQKHFANLQQVFLYITDECNLRCIQCLYKPNLILAKEIDFNLALSLLMTFRNLGAYKLSIIGGEPTRYGRQKENEPLFDLIKESRKMGYKYIRMDTNGQFDSKILENKIFQSLDDLSFSIDGHNNKIDDRLRGNGAFHSTLKNLRKAVKLGYNVHITTCITKYNIGYDRDGKLLLEKMIEFAQEEGAKKINFHCVFIMGTPMDSWTGDVHIDPNEYLKIYSILRKKIDEKSYRIKIRLPQHIINEKEFSKNPKYYGYCPVKLGERVLIHPDGIIRVCSSLLSTPYGIARYNEKEIKWEEISNEMCNHKVNEFTPCTNQTALYKNGIVPLCFSFKPKQDEIVWKKLKRDTT